MKAPSPERRALHAPHQHIATRSEAERFLVSLFDAMWARYRARHAYAQVYERVVAEHGARFRNDHLAFRTLATQSPHLGIAAVSRPFEALGYRVAGAYQFPDKYLASVHLEHPRAELPKLFISELQCWRLSPRAQRVIDKTARGHRPLLSVADLSRLARLEEVPPAGRARLLRTLQTYFEELPWPAPEKKDVLALDAESQFGAWVLVNGYDVNHFTALVDSHGVESLGDLEKTVRALRAAGVPMKAEIEGARGSRLRQSATLAVTREVAVRERGRPASMPWSWAYFELAERPLQRDRRTGARTRFEGFLGGQATHLFELTRRSTALLPEKAPIAQKKPSLTKLPLSEKLRLSAKRLSPEQLRTSPAKPGASRAKKKG